jgi:hypothetical protein
MPPAAVLNADRNSANQMTTDRRAIVQADVIRRLRGVCSHLSEEEFHRLVNKMVERQLKYEIAK